jgi:hypothetical protein
MLTVCFMAIIFILFFLLVRLAAQRWQEHRPSALQENT